MTIADKERIPAHLLGDGTMAIPAALAQLGNRIRRMREERGWTLQQLADESGVGKSVLSRLESGERLDPRISTVAPIATALDISLDELLLGKAQKKPAPRSLHNVRRSLENALREVELADTVRRR